jgi:hypothetical protein
VGMVRDRMRQAACANNLRQIGIAMINYSTDKGTLPGYIQPVLRSDKRYVVWIGSGMADSTYGSTNVRAESRISWAAVLLPRMDRNDIWQRITDGSVTGESVRPIEAYICPVDTDIESGADNAGTSYIVNSGDKALYVEMLQSIHNAGLFVYRRKV